MSVWSPKPTETAAEYVERVGGWVGSNIHMTKTLQSEFGMTHADAKRQALMSRAFWRRFYRDLALRVAGRGGTPKGAVGVIMRKNKPENFGKPVFSIEEIKALVHHAWDRRS